MELDFCFTYYFPLLQGFGWKTSSGSYVFEVFPPFATEKPMFFVNVRDLGVQGHVGIPGMFSLGKWRQGGMIFGENSLNLMANPFQLMGITYLITTLFRGHGFFMIFGVGMISYIYTQKAPSKGCQLNPEGW